jgi:hypothetical protein
MQCQEKAATSNPKVKRNDYNQYDEVQRLKIARYAIDNGPAKASKHYSILLGKPVNESSVRSIRNKYIKKMKAVSCCC